MRKKFVRLLVCLLLISSLVSLISIQGYAAGIACIQPKSKKVSIACQPDSGSSKYLIFTASKSGAASVTFKMEKGDLVAWSDYPDPPCTTYGSYEIKIKNSKGDTLYDEDAYCVGSKTIEFEVEANEEYTIQVYFWMATTIADSYIRNGKPDGFMEKPLSSFSTMASGSYWRTLPSISVSKVSLGEIELKPEKTSIEK